MRTDTTGPAVQAHERPGQRKVDALVDTPAGNLVVMRRETADGAAELATKSLVSGKVNTLVNTPSGNLAVMRRQTTQLAGPATNSLVSGKQDKVDDTCVVTVAR